MKNYMWLFFAIAFFFISCNLPDSGRKAALQIDFSQPDIFTSEITGSERIIPTETDRIEIILYKPFSGDPLSDTTLDLLDETLKGQILSREGSALINLSMNTPGDLSNTIGDLEPGYWNILVGTFDKDTTEWAGGRSGILNAMTYRYKPAVELQTGMNYIDMPLKLNESIFTNTIVDSVQDPNSYADINGNLFTNYSFNTSIAVSIIGIIPTTARIIYTNGSNIPPSNIHFYDTEGHKLDLPFVNTSEPYWELDGTATSTLVIVAFCPDYPYDSKRYELYISPLEVYDLPYYPDINLEFSVIEQIIGGA